MFDKTKASKTEPNGVAIVAVVVGILIVCLLAVNSAHKAVIRRDSVNETTALSAVVTGKDIVSDMTKGYLYMVALDTDKGAFVVEASQEQYARCVVGNTVPATLTETFYKGRQIESPVLTLDEQQNY